MDKINSSDDHSTHHGVHEAMVGDDDVEWIHRPRWTKTVHPDLQVADNADLHH
jgi:hypothetical protein